MEQMHTYNELKDLAQALIGKLAVLEGCTSAELYPHFGLDLAD